MRKLLLPLIIFAASLIPSIARAAFTSPIQIVSYAGTSGEDSHGFVLSSVGSGRLIIAAGAVWNAAGGPASVSATDTLTTSYTCTIGTDANVTTYICRGVTGSSGANTVTVDPAGSGNFISGAVMEWSGQHATPFDVDGGFTITGASLSVAEDITTVAVNALIIGVMTREDSSAIDTITPGAGYTEVAEVEDCSSQQCFSVIYRVVATPGIYTVNWILDGARDTVSQTNSFAPSVSAVTVRHRPIFQ